MEKPATYQAIKSYEQQLEERYGTEIRQAAQFLTDEPHNPEAHRQYHEAIVNLLKTNKEEQND